jgi:hypothetical protein
MIEHAMIFVLGFLIAGVLALATAPAIWRRALRLSARRVELQLPLSDAEIRAERDQVRAEAAVAQRRMEQKIAALNLSRAGDMEELGRRATALAAAEASNLALQAKLEATRDDLNDATAAGFAAEKALHDTQGLLARTSDELAELTAAHRSLEIVAEDRRLETIAAEARTAELQRRFDALEASLAEVEGRLATTSQEAARLTEDLGAARGEIGQLQFARETLERRLAAETARLEALQAEHDMAGREADVVAAELRATKARLDMDGHSMSHLRSQLETAIRKQEAATLRARDGEGVAATRIETMRAENAALQGALDAARRELARLQANPSIAAGAASPRDDEILRESIQEIGAAVVRLVGRPPTPGATAATDAPRTLAGLRINDLRPRQTPVVAASAEQEAT